MGALFGGGGRSQPRVVVAPAPEKPISPVTNRATVEGTIRKRRRSLLAERPASLLNEDTQPLGSTG